MTKPPEEEQQLGIDFDAPAAEDRSHAHHSMRVTSLDAYRELEGSGKHSQRSDDVLAAFMRSEDDLTGQECTRILRGDGLMPMEAWPVHPAIYSLRKKGFLTETTRRECRVTERQAIAYRPTQFVEPQQVVNRVAKPNRIAIGVILAELKSLIHHRRKTAPEYERPEPSLSVEAWLIYLAKPKGTR